jgi:hypothetical protein
VVRRSVDQLTLAGAGEEAGYNRACERNVLAHGGVDLLLSAIAFNLPKKLRVSRGYERGPALALDSRGVARLNQN